MKDAEGMEPVWMINEHRIFHKFCVYFHKFTQNLELTAFSMASIFWKGQG